MSISRPSSRFLLLCLAGAVFVILTSRALPPVVASQFDGAGAANAFMGRGFYTGFMLAFVVGMPLLIAYLSAFVFARSPEKINVPNREYWLAPERRQETIDYLCRHMTRFATLLLALLCYAHWLVVLAHTVVPPRLSTPWFLGGLGVFAGLSGIWAIVLLRRFRKNG